jgi:hypothetical protein
MRSRAALAVLVTALVGVAALLIGRAGDERPLQQRLGVFVQGPVAPLGPGHVACQAPVGLADRTPAITFNPGTPQSQPGPAMLVTLRDTETSKVVASGRLAQGFDPRKAQTVELQPAAPARVVSVCFRNLGPGTVLLFGDSSVGGAIFERAQVKGKHPTVTTSEATLDGRRLQGRDIAMVFPRPEPKSVLALVPQMFRRAALFRPGWVGAWTFWLLAALILIGAPLLLARALAGAEDDSDPSLPSSRP